MEGQAQIIRLCLRWAHQKTIAARLQESQPGEGSCSVGNSFWGALTFSLLEGLAIDQTQ